MSDNGLYIHIILHTYWFVVVRWGWGWGLGSNLVFNWYIIKRECNACFNTIIITDKLKLAWCYKFVVRCLWALTCGRLVIKFAWEGTLMVMWLKHSCNLSFQ
jgi:hypothetical protein